MVLRSTDVQQYRYTYINMYICMYEMVILCLVIHRRWLFAIFIFGRPECWDLCETPSFGPAASWLPSVMNTTATGVCGNLPSSASSPLTGLFVAQIVCVLSSHWTVLSTQRHQQYPQCPCWFFVLKRYKFCGNRLRQRKTKTNAISQGKASEMPAYLVREHHKTSQTRKIRKMRTKETKKPTGALKNVMQED